MSSTVKSDSRPKPPAHDPPNKAQLSCERCTWRKVRCDKGQPCSSCVGAGKECVPIVRARLPRGRKGGRKEGNSELRARLKRLEDLVVSLKSDGPERVVPAVVATPAPVLATQQVVAAQVVDARPPGIDIARSLGSTLWTQLGSELNGLREVLEAEDEEDISAEQSTPESYSSQTQMTSPAGPSILSSETVHEAVQYPSPEATRKMLELYRERVDFLVTCIHCPSFTRSLETNSPYLGHLPGEPVFEALRCAVYYCVFCTLIGSEGELLFGESRETLRNRWKAHAENALEKVGLLTCHDIVMLQALMVYMVALRSHDNGPRAWTLLAVAVRIAHALHLHREESYRSLTFYLDQVYRRTWWSLIGIDIQACMDRGTDPAIPNNDYDTLHPIHTNTDNIREDTAFLKPEVGCVTDSTFIMIHCETANLLRQFNFILPGDAARPPTLLQKSWQARQEAVMDLQQSLQQRYLQYCIPGRPIDSACLGLASVVTSHVQLYAVRPLQRHPALDQPPPEFINVLLLATDAMERKRWFNNTTTGSGDWMIRSFLDWHVVAVALAELCAKQQDEQLADRAWIAVEAAWADLSVRVAEGQSGQLWRSMKRLISVARQKRRPSQMDQISSQVDLWQLNNLNMAATMPGGEAQYAPQNPMTSNQMNLDQSTLLPLLEDGQDPWMNWQTFMDDMAQTNNIWLDGGLLPSFP